VIASGLGAPNSDLYIYSPDYAKLQAGGCDYDACVQELHDGQTGVHCLLGDASDTFQELATMGIPGDPPGGFDVPQGGVFSDDGRIFHLTNASAATITNPACDFGYYGGGLHVFDTQTVAWGHITTANGNTASSAMRSTAAFLTLRSPRAWTTSI
jgi:hypothetical protein